MLKPDRKHFKRVTVAIRAHDLERLAKIHVTVSEGIRIAITEYIERMEQKK
jgi:hypothetical protein